MLAFWRDLEKRSVLQCPVCRGDLSVADQHFDCLSCRTAFPVEGGVPLLMHPNEVLSLLDEVINAFSLPPGLKPQVEKALTPLVKYRTRSHPEFANFFARFEARERRVAAVPLNLEEMAEAVRRIECLTRCFPDTLRSDSPEFRSVRIRNNSDHILFTDERNPLYLSYRIFTPEGEPILFEGCRTPLPCQLCPGRELTIPAMVKLPQGLTGQFVICFHLMLAGQPSVRDTCSPSPALSSWRRRLAALRNLIRSRPSTKPALAPATTDHWFDEVALAEMRITAGPGTFKFPSVKRSKQHEFDIHQDVARADKFLLEVIDDLRARGITHPRVLEVGAGVYPVSLRVCDRNMTVVVSDISLVMQTLASLMHANNPAVLDGRAAFAAFDVTNSPFRDRSFDIICMCAAFHHVSAPDEFLKSVASMLSVQGRFVALREPCVVDPLNPTYLSELENGFNEQMFELPEWHDIFTRNGFIFDKTLIDYETSLKFSARLVVPRESLTLNSCATSQVPDQEHG